MSADKLIAQLEGVRETGHGRWIAKCPGHDDAHASLSVRELDDGRVLVHDFAGCSVHEIVAAIGLDLSELFPPSESRASKGERRPFPAADVLRCVAFEVMLVGIAAGRLASGHLPDDEERSRLSLASSRLLSAAQLAGVSGNA